MSQVKLLVYDLSRGLASQLSEAILGQRIDGIWHTGVLVYGREYYFGGGIQCSSEGDFARDNNLQPCQIIDLGITQRSQSELTEYLRSINSLFTASTYDLLTNNCNNFSDNISRFLLGQGIPSYIVDLPQIVFNTPGGMVLRPMIENMQNAVRQQNGGGLDPFASNDNLSRQANVQYNGYTAEIPQAYVPILANLPVPVNVAPSASELKSSNQILSKMKISPLVSSEKDNHMVQTMIKKLSNLKSADKSTAALTANELQELRKLEEFLRHPPSATAAASRSLEDNGALESAQSHLDGYISLLHKLLREHPSVQTTCLFLLRLLVLRLPALSLWTQSTVACIEDVLRRLQAEFIRYRDHSSTTGNSNVSSLVMGMCVLSNLLTTVPGQQYLLQGLGSTAALEDLSSFTDHTQLFDLLFSNLSLPKVEVKQMALAVALNYTLACAEPHSSESIHSLIPRTNEASGGDGSPLPPLIVQVLCGCVDSIEDEADSLCRDRKLMITAAVIRTQPSNAVALLSDLGFKESLIELKNKITSSQFQGAAPSHPSTIESIIDELLAGLTV